MAAAAVVLACRAELGRELADLRPYDFSLDRCTENREYLLKGARGHHSVVDVHGKRSLLHCSSPR